MLRKQGVLLALGLLIGNAVIASAAIQSVPIASGFSRPLFAGAPKTDMARLFVVEQHTGRIRVIDLATKTVQAAPFLTIPGITTGGEQGLLGLAFHPDYADNGFLYVNYTVPGGGAAGHTEIARFTAEGNPLTATAASFSSKKIILTFNQPESNHNGGWMGFGPDGYLYIASGDGGGANDLHGAIGSGQDRNTLLGKILRIDVDQGDPYSIPADNPFFGDASKKGEIWAFGLRNPWRCSFDRGTGDLWIGDVGQGAREEIDVIPAGSAGLNFGWRPREGLIQTPAFPNEAPVTPRTDPVHDYVRALGFSVTGGYVYRGENIPELHGFYIFADYGSSRFWTFRLDGTAKTDFSERTQEIRSGTVKPSQVSSFGEDAAGELYICSLTGTIFQITAVPSETPDLTNVRTVGNEIQFSFESIAGKGYVVEATDSLDQIGWQAVNTYPATSANAVIGVTNQISGMQRYYRVRVQ